MNLARLSEYPVVAIDTETTGLYWHRDRLFGVAVATWDGERVESAYWDTRENPRVLDALRDHVPKIKRLVNHHLKFDVHMLLNERVRVPLDRIECTMVRAGLINEHEISGNKGYDLDSLCRKYIGEGKVDIWQELSDLFGGAATRAVQSKNLQRAPVSLTAKYAAPDPSLALKLWLWQEKEIEKQGLQQVWELERRVTPVLVEIERQGVRVDVERTTESRKSVAKLISAAQSQLNALAGKVVNANSPVQMRELFGCRSEKAGERTRWYTKDGYELEVTDSDNPSIDKDALRAMEARGDKRAAAILTIRRMTKADSFLKNHILAHEVKGRVYPNYNQTKSESGLGTGTGRFSIDDPALQQIPMHDIDVAEIVRPCFIPERSHQWCSADWKQFEFRWFAHYVKDPTITKMYEDDPNADFHSTVASITGITRDRKFAGDTANAKQINLGLVFGMGEGEMAYNMGMEYELRVDKNKRSWKVAGQKAKDIFAKYHTAIPGVRTLLQQASSIARSRGYVTTAMGRHIRFPGGKYVHKAGGLVFQGTSADCIKLKMVELHPICKENEWLMLLSVHDELDFSIPDKQAKKAEKVIRDRLEDFNSERCPVKCRIPIRSDINFGTNWWEACK